MSKDIEQGLLPIFRFFLWLRFALLVLTICAWVAEPSTRTLRFPLLGLVEVSLLLVYLYWGALREVFGRWYLPIALVIASVGPIVENALAVVIRAMNGLPTSTVYEDRWLLVLALFIPLLVIAWQYRFRTVVIFNVLTSLLELALFFLIGALGGPLNSDVFWLAIIRAVLFTFFGTIVVQLMNGQREQRAQLEQANAQLALANQQIAQFATTMEQLAISQERNRLARELHDTLAHSLSAVAVQLEATKSVWGADPDTARGMLDQALVVTRSGLKDARRAIHDLRASPLDELGLVQALHTRAQAVATHMGAALTADLPPTLEELNPQTEQGIYRIADEALSNIARHAHGTTHIELRIQQHDGALTMAIADDGPGFDTSATLINGHFGLRGLQERARLLGGELAIRSDVGKGTRVQLEVTT